MKIFTSYFAISRKLPPDAVQVSIALYQPKNWGGNCCRSLAPSRNMLDAYKSNNDQEAYKKSYNQMLGVRSQEALFEGLKLCYEGRDVILMCYEKPDAFCHRHLVAAWLKAAGIPCEEWGAAQANDKYPLQRNGCNCASPADMHHGWECSITDGACMYLFPDAEVCAKQYGEGPLVGLIPQEGSEK